MERVLALASDPDIRVRYQVAFAVGGIANDSGATAAAVAILRQSPGDRWVRAAVLGAPPDQCARIAQAWLAAGLATTDAETLRQFVFVAGAQNASANLDALFAAARDARALTDVFWSGLGDGLRQAGKNFRSALRGAAAQSAADLLTGAARTARVTTGDPAARVAAVKLLGYDDFAGARPVLAALLAPSEAPPVQIAAVKALASFTHADVAKTLLDAWSGCTPAVREEVLAALLARRERLAPLLTAMENNVVSPGQVSTARRTQLLATTDAALKARAQKIFGQGSSATRTEVVRSYQPVIGMTGSAAHGSKIYDAVCAACHRYAGRGSDLGPNLETIRGWDKEKLLLHILDPNREVAAAYLAYTIELKDGGTIAGMITEETAGGIKVKRIGAPEETILRQNIAKLTSSTLSLMPEGLEAALPPADMADLLAYLTAP